MTGTAHPQPFVPEFDDPYVARDADVSDFRYETDLVILRMREACPMGEDREADYIVAAPYRVSFLADGERHTIEVPKGMLTDLTSVPRPFRWLVERVGPHLEAAIVHDFLFIAWQDLGRGAQREDWLFANRVMVAGMRAARIRPWICWVIAWALSTRFSWTLYRARDAPPRYVDLDAAPVKTQGFDPDEGEPMA